MLDKKVVTTSGKWWAVFLFIKNNKQLANNYQLVSLFPICSKIFEKLLLDSTREFFNMKIVSSDHSEFQPNNSTIYQLLSIKHAMLTVFNGNPTLHISMYLSIKEIRFWLKDHIKLLIENTLKMEEQRILTNCYIQ